MQRKLKFSNTVVISSLITALLAVLVLTGCQKSVSEVKGFIILATTTSVQDSGLLDYLLPQFSKETGIKVKAIAVGSGEALKMGARGDADIILAHSPDAEKKMLRDKTASKRETFMYNYFAIVGPKNDPAAIRSATSTEEALRKIVGAKQIFVSRGDQSGTNKKELKIWKSAGLSYETNNYIKTGQGMESTLQVANEKEGYVFTDKATFISNKNNLKRLEILLSDKASLKNEYSIIELSPKKVKFNREGAKKFKNWLLSKRILKKISVFGKEEFSKPLFIVSR